MAENIKAKPTEYSGVIFRSKLEAKWAMYFDLLGIEWIYEPDSFILESGDVYCPDFYLEGLEVFCEVKPYQQEDDRWYEFVKLENLPNEPEYRMILLFGENIHCYPSFIIYNGGCNLVTIAHSDSKFAPLYYAADNLDSTIVKENQQFCDDVNNFKFD